MLAEGATLPFAVCANSSNELLLVSAISNVAVLAAGAIAALGGPRADEAGPFGLQPVAASATRAAALAPKEIRRIDKPFSA
jgi:hypothetical protein